MYVALCSLNYPNPRVVLIDPYNYKVLATLNRDSTYTDDELITIAVDGPTTALLRVTEGADGDIYPQ